MNQRRLKRIHYNMIRRCHNDFPKGYESNAYYRDKGIIVCDAWRNSYDEFEKWAIINGYQDDLTIDRIDPNGNYDPGNCRWITKSENSKRIKRNSNGNDNGSFTVYRVFHFSDGGDFNEIIDIGVSLRKYEQIKDEWYIRDKELFGHMSTIIRKRKVKRTDYIGQSFVFEDGHEVDITTEDERGMLNDRKRKNTGN